MSFHRQKILRHINVELVLSKSHYFHMFSHLLCILSRDSNRAIGFVFTIAPVSCKNRRGLYFIYVLGICRPLVRRRPPKDPSVLNHDGFCLNFALCNVFHFGT